MPCMHKLVILPFDGGPGPSRLFTLFIYLVIPILLCDTDVSTYCVNFCASRFPDTYVHVNY